ncbi:MAG: ATP-binding cassette domain-containing protein [Gemmatimonadetes bacterium]|nr:ATP-binding cassette domain-containing protein [Gemmatimonadota bacterium]MYD26481.1 ATP-binding cassette domain-containing protein [Gemmatimonadota bacterium]MYI99166.1 ATP-binding cassette domain-containing protein [Gemmatimonadota bacterium]
MADPITADSKSTGPMTTGPMTTGPIIVGEHLAHRYGSGFHLHVENLALYAGKTYAVYGSNGSGKTTLLNILALLTLPQEGRILFEGRPMNGADPGRSRQYRRRVTLLMQHVYLFRSTVFDNVASGLRFRGMAKEAIEARVTGMLDKVGLRQFAHRTAHSLSGGEAQRAGLARALVTDPDVLLLDEPTASVDAAHGKQIEAILAETCRQRRMTVVLSTHQYDQAYRIADEVLIMRDGRMLEKGPENVFKGRIEETADGPVVKLDGGMTLRSDTTARGPAHIVISSQEIRLARSPAKPTRTPDAANTLVGVVTAAAVDGDRIRLDVDAGPLTDAEGGPRPVEAAGLRLTVHVARASFSDMGITVGDTVHAAIDASAVRAS